MKGTKKICFAILHYQATDITVQCVDSILKLDNYGHDVSVIIVDNGSPNQSGNVLQKKYANNQRVNVILAGVNNGFARGNNIGFQYAKNNIQADIVIVINNDVIIEQKNFIKILADYVIENPSVSVIAPDIKNKVGYHQNPVRAHQISNRELAWTFSYNLMLQIIMRVPALNKVFMQIINKKHEKNKTVTTNNVIIQGTFVPHGAAIIYAGEFIQLEECAFNPDTFLYCEEDILYEYLLHRKYIEKYVAELQVLHLEDVSTDAITENQIKKRIFVSKHKLHSLGVLVRQRKMLKNEKMCSWRWQ